VLLEKSEKSDELALMEAEIDDPAAVEKILTNIGTEASGGRERRRIVPLPAFDTEDIT
jgi:hypothetical protein